MPSQLNSKLRKKMAIKARAYKLADCIFTCYKMKGIKVPRQHRL